MMTLQEFLEKPRANSHIDHHGYSTLYLRKSPRHIHFVNKESKYYPSVIQIGSVEIYEELRGKGLFSKLLNDLQKENLPIYVENVLNDHLSQILERKGFESVDKDYITPCYLKI